MLLLSQLCFGSFRRQSLKWRRHRFDAIDRLLHSLDSTTADDFVVNVATVFGCRFVVCWSGSVVLRFGFKILWQRCKASDVVVDLIDLVVFGQDLVTFHYFLLLWTTVTRRQFLLFGQLLKHLHRLTARQLVIIIVAVDVVAVLRRRRSRDGVNQIGSAASQWCEQERDRYLPVLTVESQVLAEMGVIDLDAVRHEAVLVEAALRESLELLGRLETLTVGG